MLASDLAQGGYKSGGSVAKGVANEWRYEMPAIWLMRGSNEPVAILRSLEINKLSKTRRCPARSLRIRGPPLDKSMKLLGRVSNLYPR